MTQIYEISPKLTMAREQLEVFKAETLEYLESDPHDFPIELDPKWNGLTYEVDYVIRLSISKPVPSKLRVMPGNILYQIRSSLDHLIFALSDKYSIDTKGSNIDLDLAGTEFPIFKDRGKFRRLNSRGPDRGKPARGSGLYKMRYVHPDAQAMIESFQPFNVSENKRVEYLWVLHQLCNIDKHRRLNLMGVPIGKLEVHCDPPVRHTHHEVLYKRPLKDGDLVGRGTFVPPFPGTPEMTIIRHTPPELVIEEPFEMRVNRYEYAGWLLEDILDFVELSVLPEFASFL